MCPDIQKREEDGHKTCRDEHEAWLKDINRWQTEHQEAMFALERFEAFLRNHADAVRTHAEAIDSHERHLNDPGAIEAHGELAAKHAEQHQFHERIAVRHGCVISQLRLLIEAMSETG